MDTLQGMKLIFESGIQPDLIYVDASHDEVSVRNDVETALTLFPQAILVGDDWTAESVQKAIIGIVAERNLHACFRCNVTAWWLVPNCLSEQ